MAEEGKTPNFPPPEPTDPILSTKERAALLGNRFNIETEQLLEWTNDRLSGGFKDFVHTHELTTLRDLYMYLANHRADPVFQAEVATLARFDRHFLYTLVVRLDPRAAERHYQFLLEEPR